MTGAKHLFRGILKQPGLDASYEAEAHRGLGEALSAATQFAPATAELERALRLLERASDVTGIAWIHEDLAVVAFRTGDMTQAKSLFDQSLAEFTTAGDQRKSLEIEVNEIFLLPEKDKRAAIDLLLVKAQTLGDDEGMARLWHDKGDELYKTGNYASAAELYEKAIAVFEKLGDKEEMATTLVSVGRLHAHHGDPSLARSDYHKALHLQHEIEAKIGEIQTVNAIAVSYENEGNTDAAINHYGKALTMAEAAKSPRYILFERGNLATEYMAARQFIRALPLLKQVIAEEKSPFLLAYRYKAESKCYFGVGDYASALEAANESISLGREHADQSFLADAYAHRARVFSALNDATRADADSKEALSMLEKLRSRLVPKDYLKRGFGDVYQELYEIAIDIRFREKDFRGAAEAAEEARARAFIDLMATRQATKSPDAGDTLAPAGKAVFDSTASTGSFSADEMFDAAQRLHSTLLTYWVGENELFILLGTQERVMRGARVKVSAKQLEELVAKAQKTAGGINEQSGANQSSAWNQLYGYLIRPVRRFLPSQRGALLTIVPNGPLFGLPFSALRDEHGHYLIEQFATHYVPAAAVLKFTRENEVRARNGEMKYLLVASGAARQIDGRNFSALPEANAEIDSIRKIAGQENTSLIEDNGARVAVVEEAMKSARVVHIAAHAVVDNSDPLSSFVALAPDSDAADPDMVKGKLTAATIYDLRIPAELVVLSACDSGLGKVGGDGVISLTRAFFSGGAASVMASLWDVPDAPTGFVMREFYGESTKNKSKASALRNAQLKLMRALRSGRFSLNSAIGRLNLSEDPHLWAGFVLEGNP